MRGEGPGSNPRSDWNSCVFVGSSFSSLQASLAVDTDVSIASTTKFTSLLASTAHPPVCIFPIDYNNTATMVINPHKLGVHKVLQHIPLNKVFDAPAKARLAKAVNIADLRLCAKQRAHKVS